MHGVNNNIENNSSYDNSNNDNNNNNIFRAFYKVPMLFK